MSRDVDDACSRSVGMFQPRETEFNRDAALFFFGKSVGIALRQRVDGDDLP